MHAGVFDHVQSGNGSGLCPMYIRKYEFLLSQKEIYIFFGLIIIRAQSKLHGSFYK
jgi:hypothetical protein